MKNKDKTPRRRGYTAPIVIAVLLVLYYAGLAALLICVPGISWWGKTLLCVLPAAVSTGVIAVTVQRLKEISSGETDDLDRY